MNKEKIKLTEEGYNEFLEHIKDKEKELDELRIYKGTDAIFQGDNWHDNPTLYQAELKEVSLMREIKGLKHRLNNIEVIKESINKDVIDIGDIVKIDIIVNNEKEEEIFKLVGTSPKFDNDIEEVTVNSPLGKAIYLKKIGDTVTYKVKDNDYTVIIKEKK